MEFQVFGGIKSASVFAKFEIFTCGVYTHGEDIRIEEYTKEHTLGGTYTRRGYTQGIYTHTERDIHKGGTYTWLEHTHGEDIHTEKHTLEKTYTRWDIYMAGTYTRRGYTNGGTYTRRNICTEDMGHTH